MRMLVVLCAALLTFVVPTRADSYTITTLSENTVLFENTDCERTNSCSLRHVRFYAREYRLNASFGTHYGSGLFAWYETDSVSSLEDYVFVQFIRGCMYSTYRSALGAVVTVYDRVHTLSGEMVLFKHTEWVIDSLDADPAGESRHYVYQWNTPPYGNDPQTRRYYGIERPEVPVLYISDRPSTVFFSDDGSGNVSAVNASLEFRVGIYHASDVPTDVLRTGRIPAEPIASFSWRFLYVYDHDEGAFKKQDGIAEACR